MLFTSDIHAWQHLSSTEGSLEAFGAPVQTQSLEEESRQNLDASLRRPVLLRSTSPVVCIAFDEVEVEIASFYSRNEEINGLIT